MSKKKPVEKTEEKAIYMYIGPSIRGVIQQGKIYEGTMDEILNKLSAAIEQYPSIRKLIVKDTEVAAALHKIENGLAPYAISFKNIQKEGG